MPFFQLASQLVYFAHVPKCGGTSIERGLIDNGFKLSFRDGQWWDRSKSSWSRSSPQHITLPDLDRIIDPTLFDHSFAVVRNPIDRFLSAFNHNREDNRIPFYVSLERFVSRLEARSDYFVNQFDNHFVRAVDFVPMESKVFLLEDGFGQVEKWLSETSGGTFSAHFGHANKRAWNKVRIGNRYARFIKRNIQRSIPQRPGLNPELSIRISKLYQADFERFEMPSAPNCVSPISMPASTLPACREEKSSQAA